jgi:deoxyadenosine/deoxycytidine kinase
MARIVRAVVGGGIGVGKSTLIESARTFFMDNEQRYAQVKMIVTPEPVEAWVDFLKDIYDDEATHSAKSAAIFALQTAVTVHFTNVVNETDDVANSMPRGSLLIHIMERSLADSMYVFAHHARITGTLMEHHSRLLSDLTDLMTKPARTAAEASFGKAHARIYVFLDADSAVTYARMIERGRASEKTVPITYLEDLDYLHRNLLKHHLETANVTWVSIDASAPKIHVSNKFIDILREA